MINTANNKNIYIFYKKKVIGIVLINVETIYIYSEKKKEYLL